jgi:hypothetical protein
VHDAGQLRRCWVPFATQVTFDKVDKTRMTEMFSQQAEKVGGP